MAQLELADGRVVDVVMRPSVQEKVLAQTHLRKAWGITPKQMVDTVQSIEWLSVLPIFATLIRNGVQVRMNELMEDEQVQAWGKRLRVEPGDIPVEDETEGEQSPHPPVEATAAADE